MSPAPRSEVKWDVATPELLKELLDAPPPGGLRVRSRTHGFHRDIYYDTADGALIGEASDMAAAPQLALAPAPPNAPPPPVNPPPLELEPEDDDDQSLDDDPNDESPAVAAPP